MKAPTSTCPRPTADQILEARRLYAQYETRNDVYLHVLPLVAEGLRMQSEPGDVRAAEGCGELLMIWNRDYYRYRPHLAISLVNDLVALIHGNRHNLQVYQARRLGIMGRKECDRVARLFVSFEKTLGPTGECALLSRTRAQSYRRGPFAPSPALRRCHPSAGTSAMTARAQRCAQPRQKDCCTGYLAHPRLFFIVDEPSSQYRSGPGPRSARRAPRARRPRRSHLGT